VPFEKWHALGNSYLVLERVALGRPLAAGVVRALCDPGTGVGADGVLEITDVRGPECELTIWNPDGSTAELSGNGTRIAARWLADRAGALEVRVHVGPREVVARLREGSLVEQELGRVEVGEPETIDVDGEAVEVVPVSVGNPHAVIGREPDRAELLRLGPLVERHARFPGRTNVQLVRPDGPHTLTVAVWERGAGETSSSGTSACAAAAAAVALGWCASPVSVRLPGGELTVELDADLAARLVGPAVRVCEGLLAPEWLALSTTPRP
jgi:diaminopimelate epimerase